MGGRRWGVGGWGGHCYQQVGNATAMSACGRNTATCPSPARPPILPHNGPPVPFSACTSCTSPCNSLVVHSLVVLVLHLPSPLSPLPYSTHLLSSYTTHPPAQLYPLPPSSRSSKYPCRTQSQAPSEPCREAGGGCGCDGQCLHTDAVGLLQPADRAAARAHDAASLAEGG